MITVENLTRVYGHTRAVDDLSFEVRPGMVTGFLGPNGAGKSTTMRAILGLDRPTSGRALVNGKKLADHAAPMTQIGAHLEPRSVHPKRSARDHLLALAATTNLPLRRVDSVLELVGLSSVAHRRAGEFSLGMAQRLGVASALLGDPETVMLDEPINGLDPEGILWIRNLLRQLATEGRTVLVSSHLISEMAMTAERFIVIGRGRLIADLSSHDLAAQSGGHRVFVRTLNGAPLREALIGPEVAITNVVGSTDAYEVTGLSAEEIGRRAFTAGIVLFELTPKSDSLEAAFMELTEDAIDYRSSITPTSDHGTPEGNPS